MSVETTLSGYKKSVKSSSAVLLYVSTGTPSFANNSGSNEIKLLFFKASIILFKSFSEKAFSFFNLSIASFRTSSFFLALFSVNVVYICPTITIGNVFKNVILCCCFTFFLILLVLFDVVLLEDILVFF